MLITLDWNSQNNIYLIDFLILDNVNRLALENPKLLASLQDQAKDAADYGKFIMVFVTN